MFPVDPVTHRRNRLLKGSSAGETVVGEEIMRIMERDGFVRVAESTQRGWHGANEQ
jgi:hypothetical protein